MIQNLSLIYIKVTPALWLIFGFATLLLGWGPSHSPDAFWHTLVFWRVIFILWPFLCGAILMSHISIGTIPVCMFSKALWVLKSIKETGKKKDIEMGHKSVTKKSLPGLDHTNLQSKSSTYQSIMGWWPAAVILPGRQVAKCAVEGPWWCLSWLPWILHTQ